MGLFNFLKSKKSGIETNKVFVSKKHLPFEMAKELRKSFLEILPHQDERSKQFNLASSMLLNKAYDFSIDSYKFLITKYPDAIAECQSQIGACFYFKGAYENAIIYYLKAKNNGADEGMMDDNIWEAAEAHYKISKDLSIILDYLDHYPEGKYVKKAKKIIL